jgi:hypothetical protein
MSNEELAQLTINNAAEALAKTDAGKDALFYLRCWMNDTGTQLTGLDQVQALFLMQAYWGAFPGYAATAVEKAMASAFRPGDLDEMVFEKLFGDIDRTRPSLN